MGGICRIATWALNGARYGRTQREILDATLDLCDGIAGYKPDIICFPEIFLKNGGDVNNPDRIEISAEAERRFAEKAAQLKSYIMISVYEPSKAFPDKRYNSSVLFDRGGQVCGRYHKHHTVYEESKEGNVIPGYDLPVIETDFGRVAMLTCFDIGWRHTWERLAEKGAELVIWAAAYDGGNLLNTYAAYNMYYVASSVRTSHAKVVDPTGRTIAESSCWNGLCMTDINLSTTIFHIDRQFKKIDEIRHALGDKVTINSYSEENIFTVASNDSEWPIQRICENFGLTTYRDYHAEAAALQDEWRVKYKE
jgi:predicted amidohydrolase